MTTIFTLFMVLASEQAGTSGIVRVTVEGFNSREGRLVAFLFQEEAGLPPSVDEIFAGSSAVIADSALTVSFMGVPDGEYALLAFQDLNGNGMPDIGASSGLSEPFCYSRSGCTDTPLFGPGEGAGPIPGERPGNRSGEIVFDMISFRHEGDETLVELTLSEGRRPADRPDGAPEGAPGGGPGGMPGGGFR